MFRLSSPSSMFMSSCNLLRRSCFPSCPRQSRLSFHTRFKRSPSPRASEETPMVSIEDRDTFWHPTGVAFVDEFESLSSLGEAASRAGLYIALAFVAAAIGNRMLQNILNKSTTIHDEGKNGRRFNIFQASVASFAKPASKLLPTYSIVCSATVVSALVQVCITKKNLLEEQFFVFASLYAQRIQALISIVTQLIQDTADVLVVITIAWTIVILKDRMIYYFINAKLGGNTRVGLGRILESTATFLNLVIYFATILGILSVCGINLTPLLASFGGVTVVLGLAYQNFLSNIASGIALYASPPFEVGHDIKLLSSDKVVVEGTVLAILPIRIVLRTPEGSTLYIDNATVIDHMIQNDSQRH